MLNHHKSCIHTYVIAQYVRHITQKIVKSLTFFSCSITLSLSLSFGLRGELGGNKMCTSTCISFFPPFFFPLVQWSMFFGGVSNGFAPFREFSFREEHWSAWKKGIACVRFSVTFFLLPIFLSISLLFYTCSYLHSSPYFSFPEGCRQFLLHYYHFQHLVFFCWKVKIYIQTWKMYLHRYV